MWEASELRSCRSCASAGHPYISAFPGCNRVSSCALRDPHFPLIQRPGGENPKLGARLPINTVLFHAHAALVLG